MPGGYCSREHEWRDRLRAVLAKIDRIPGASSLAPAGVLQHVVIEYARNVLGRADAEHAEIAPEAA